MKPEGSKLEVLDPETLGRFGGSGSFSNICLFKLVELEPVYFVPTLLNKDWTKENREVQILASFSPEDIFFYYLIGGQDDDQ